MTPRPYEPHELDQHPDVERVRATIKLAVEHARQDTIADLWEKMNLMMTEAGRD